MLNYMKSEWYRVTHSKGMYVMTAVLSALVLLMNVINAICNHMLTDFPYGTVRFSLNVLTSSPFILLVMGAVVAACLFTEDRRNGVLKNAVSYGIPRTDILTGKCLVSLLTAVIVMVVVVIVYVGSAYLLLLNPELLPLREFLSGIGATLLCAVASMILMIVLNSLCQKETIAVIWWVVILCLIPVVFFFIGLKVEIFGRIAEWMPYNFLRIEVFVSMNGYRCIWDTTEGLVRCIAAGAIGIVVFLVFGIWRFRKQEF